MEESKGIQAPPTDRLTGLRFLAAGMKSRLERAEKDFLRAKEAYARADRVLKAALYEEAKGRLDILSAEKSIELAAAEREKNHQRALRPTGGGAGDRVSKSRSKPQTLVSAADAQVFLSMKEEIRQALAGKEEER